MVAQKMKIQKKNKLNDKQKFKTSVAVSIDQLYLNRELDTSLRSNKPLFAELIQSNRRVVFSYLVWILGLLHMEGCRGTS